MWLIFKIIQEKKKITDRYTHILSFYLLTQVSFLRLLTSSCGFELLFIVFSFLPKVLSLIFLLGQACQQQILYFYLSGNVLISPLLLKNSLYCFSFSRIVLSQVILPSYAFSHGTQRGNKRWCCTDIKAASFGLYSDLDYFMIIPRLITASNPDFRRKVSAAQIVGKKCVSKQLFHKFDNGQCSRNQKILFIFIRHQMGPIEYRECLLEESLRMK